MTPSRLRIWATGLIAVAGLAVAVPEAGAMPAWCHVVQRGESLALIARKAGASAPHLRHLNALADHASIRPGDILALPGIERLAAGAWASIGVPIRASPGHRVHENAGADADGLSRLRDRATVDRFARLRLLLPVPPSAPGLHVIGVPAWRRVTRPWTLTFLRQLGAAMHTMFGGRLRVTDLTRTEAVQRALGEWNGNAAPARGPLASTHLTGAAVDLSKVEHSDVEIAWLRTVLRRLTTRGLVDAIEEFAQPHFHVLVLRAYARYAARLRAASAIGC